MAIFTKLWLAILLTPSGFAQPSRSKILVTDSLGKPLPGVLLIVRALEEPILGRPFLSDSNGYSPYIDLHAGIYQVIATCPYGPCATTAYEFLSAEGAKEFRLTVSPKPDKAAQEQTGSLKLPSNLGDQSAASPPASQGQRSTIEAVDPQGSPFPNVLLIIRSLKDRKEIGRYLTDSNGRSPELQLNEDSYQVIATCPRGICETSAYELSASAMRGKLTLHLGLKPSDTFGGIVGADRMQLQFYVRDQKKGEKVTILVRDREARWSRSYVRKANESADIEMIDDPVFITILFDGKLIRKAVANACQRLPWVSENGVECIDEPKSLRLTVDLR